MACGCKKGRTGGSFKVKLPGGLEITKTSQAAAEAYVKAHPGAKLVVKAA